MCNFCKTLKNGGKIVISPRSTYADDNLYEILYENEKTVCSDISDFFIDGYMYKGNTYMVLNYINQLDISDDDMLSIMPFSEGLHINYCPYCGEKVSENFLNFDEISTCYPYTDVEGEFWNKYKCL